MKITSISVAEPKWLKIAYKWFDGSPVTAKNYRIFVNAFDELAATIGVSSTVPKKLYRSIKSDGTDIGTVNKLIGHVQSWSDEIGAVESFAEKKNFQSSIIQLVVTPEIRVLYSYSWDSKLIKFLGDQKTNSANNLITTRLDYADENEVLLYSPTGKFHSKSIKSILGKPQKPYDPFNREIDWGE